MIVTKNVFLSVKGRFNFKKLYFLPHFKIYDANVLETPTVPSVQSLSSFKKQIESTRDSNFPLKGERNGGHEDNSSLLIRREIINARALSGLRFRTGCETKKETCEINSCENV